MRPLRLVLPIALAMVAGCSSATAPDNAADPRPSDAAAVSGAPSATTVHSSGANESPQSTIVDPPPVPTDDEIAQIVAATAPSLALQLPEVACLGERLKQEPHLVANAKAGVEAGSEEFRRLAEIGQSCVDSIRFAPVYVDAVRDERGGDLTIEQSDCLVDRYAALSPEDLRTLTSGTLSTGDTDAQQRASEINRDLRAGCGV